MPEIGRDDEREPFGEWLTELGQRPRLGAQRLHADEHAVAGRAAHGRQAGDIADALVVELAHGLPLPRLGPEADLAKRVPPPVVEPRPPALVVPEAAGAASGCERRGDCELRKRPGRPLPHDEVHDERIVVVRSGSTRAAYGKALSEGEIPRRAGRPGRA